MKEENELYQCIFKYLTEFDEEIREEQITELMECIRFGRMQLSQVFTLYVVFFFTSQFQKCLNESFVPKQLLLEAMMYRLKKFEAPDLLESQENLNPRFSNHQRSSLIH